MTGAIEAELGVLDGEIAMLTGPGGRRRWTNDGCVALVHVGPV